MSFRRPRIVPFSSFADPGLLSLVPRPSINSPQPRFDLNVDAAGDFAPSPYGEGKVVDFLDKCYVCEKRIIQNMDVFMYSMRAFCTPDCRNVQIIIDEVLEEVPEKSRETITYQRRMND